jgi:hypothetical protein
MKEFLIFISISLIITILSIVIYNAAEKKRLVEFISTLQNGGMLNIKIGDSHDTAYSKIKKAGLDVLRSKNGNELVYQIDYDYKSFVTPHIIGINQLSFTFNEIEDKIRWMNIDFENNIRSRAIYVLFETLTKKFGEPIINEDDIEWIDKTNHISYSFSVKYMRMIIQRKQNNR